MKQISLDLKLHEHLKNDKKRRAFFCSSQTVDKVVAEALAPATLFFSDEIFGYE